MVFYVYKVLFYFYSPEMVEGRPYGEKADVWALGCILYQMCVLDPPFFSFNMLTLVKSVSMPLLETFKRKIQNTALLYHNTFHYTSA